MLLTDKIIGPVLVTGLLLKLKMSEQLKPIPLSEALAGYLDFLGARPLLSEEMENLRNSFQIQLELPDSSLQMIPTNLGRLERELKEGERALIIDAGGTGLKIANYQVKNGELVAENKEAREVNFGSQRQWQAEDFFSFIAAHIKEQEVKDINSIGFIFSFPGEAQVTENGVDIRAEDRLTKDWCIHGLKASGLVGDQLVKALKSRFEDAGLDSLPLVTMNDTVAVLFAEREARIGGVVATGFNLAIMIENMVRNMEAGNFYAEDLPVSELLNWFDYQTANYGQYLSEKQISGFGVGGQLKTFIKRGCEKNYLRTALARNIEALDASAASLILTEDWDKVEMVFGCLLEAEEKKFLTELTKRLVKRSAQMLACFLSGAKRVIGEDQLVVPVEGSYFWKTPGYLKELKYALVQLEPGESPGKMFKFTGKNKRLGLLGAARVSLDYVKD